MRISGGGMLAVQHVLRGENDQLIRDVVVGIADYTGAADGPEGRLVVAAMVAESCSPWPTPTRVTTTVRRLAAEGLGVRHAKWRREAALQWLAAAAEAVAARAELCSA